MADLLSEQGRSAPHGFEDAPSLGNDIDLHQHHRTAGIGWGRYAELFSYDDERRSFNLPALGG
ncbi:MAG: hypothetical protein JO255_22215 [Alphaproteobacteria bacterium]|nr:hypothetical protein [Alphaproteobacteria bacterium]